MGRVIGSGLSAIKEFIEKCLAAGGTPIFRTRYGDRRLPGNAVIAACWGKGKEVPGGMITDVPPHIIEEMEKRPGDWKWLREKI